MILTPRHREIGHLARLVAPAPAPRARRLGLATAIAFIGLATVGCGHAMMMLHGRNVAPPPASEFGLGPRASANGLYSATLEPSAPLRPRRMQTVQVAVTDAAGRPVEGASIEVDGGMPQHGHGLPTRPRVTKALGDGRYEIEGVRFNMGGWWEFTLAISGAGGADRVTFNLDL